MLHERIKIERLKKKLSQEELSKIIGVTQQAVGKWERARAMPDNDILLKLADFFNVSVDYLLGRSTSIQEPYAPGLSPDELALIEKYRRMKDNEKDTMHKVADTIAPNDEQAAAVGK